MRKQVLSIVLIIFCSGVMVQASDQSDVRATVQTVFEQLKAHNYETLYDLLPGSARGRMSRERFVSALQRAQEFYQLDSMDIGTTKVMGNLAVVETVL